MLHVSLVFLSLGLETQTCIAPYLMAAEEAPGSRTQKFKRDHKTSSTSYSQDAEQSVTSPPSPALISSMQSDVLFWQHSKSLLLRVSNQYFRITWFSPSRSERRALSTAGRCAGAREENHFLKSVQTQPEKYLLVQYLWRLKFKKLTFSFHHGQPATPNIRDICGVYWGHTIYKLLRVFSVSETAKQKLMESSMHIRIMEF